MTTKPTFKRSDFVRQEQTGRSSRTRRDAKPAETARRSYRPESLYLPVEPRYRRDDRSTRAPRAGEKTARAQRYDISFKLGQADVRAPAISLPQFDFSNPRWISGLVTLVLAGLLYLLWSSSIFTVQGATVIGNQRISVDEINNVLGMIEQPVFKAVPEQIEANLLTAYHDLLAVHVRVGLPNRIIVEVEERMPVMVWYQDGVMTWIDADGVAFQPRGDVSGLVQVSANGAPLDVSIDPALPPYAQSFITSDMVKVITSLAPNVPSGMPLIYDPEYGIGWQDPRGWAVYFGQNSKDMFMKRIVYQALVDRLVSQGIQPTLISMEYLDAPFFK
jgi:cell division protein FtsQ